MKPPNFISDCTNLFVGWQPSNYSFNGKEKDDETWGDGNEYDFGGRIYDSRVGRWLSVDPLAKKYSNLSPYNFTGNNPILYVDNDGKKIIIHYMEEVTNNDGTTQFVSKQFEYKPGITPPNNEYVQKVVSTFNKINEINYQDPESFSPASPSQIVNDLANNEEFTLNVFNLPYDNPKFTGIQPKAFSESKFLGLNSAPLYFDPNYGLSYTNKSGEEVLMSPLVIAGHELEHGWLMMLYRQASFDMQQSILTDGMGNVNEMFTIQGTEMDLMKYNGASILRDSHDNGGEYFNTTSEETTTECATCGIKLSNSDPVFNDNSGLNDYSPQK